MRGAQPARSGDLAGTETRPEEQAGLPVLVSETSPDGEDFGPTLRGCVLLGAVEPLLHVQKLGFKQALGFFDPQAAA